MEYWWNHPPFRLHYVTAREAYNIARAAEAGRSGDPNDYRDFLIPPPANRLVACDRAWRLLSRTPARLHLEVLEPGPVRLEFAGGAVRSIAGKVRELEMWHEHGELAQLRIEGNGPFDVVRRRPAPAGAGPGGCAVLTYGEACRQRAGES